MNGELLDGARGRARGEAARSPRAATSRPARRRWFADDGTGRRAAGSTPAAAVARRCARDPADASRPAGAAFLQVFNPPLRLIVIGAVHIAQALAPMASLAGYQVTVVDPRRAFATDSRFPDVAITQRLARRGDGGAGARRRTAVVALTHDPKLDDPALDVALRSRLPSTSPPWAAGAPMPAGSSGWAPRATTRRPSRASTARPASTSAP